MSKLLFAAVLAAAALSAPAYAAEQDPPSRQVSTAGVDFSDSEAVRALHARLARAAASVCNSYGANSRVTAADRACAAKAIDQAVRAANRPMLTAVHQGRPAEVVYAQR